MRGQKGITLVALIITIIVLLILAVVAIAAVSNDGIIDYAKNARSDYNEAQVKENGILDDYMVNYLDQWNSTETQQPEGE